MQPRFSSIALACAAALSVISMQVQAEPAQSNTKMPSLTNEGSLAPGMTTAAVRTYDTLQSSLTSALANIKRPDSGNVGTSGNSSNGTNNGNNNGNNNGTSNASNNNGNNNGTSNASSNSGGNNPSAFNNNSSGSSMIAGTTKPFSNSSGYPNTPGGNVSGGTDWLKVVQVAAPVIATLSGNTKVMAVAGIVGSSANVYNAVSSGQDLTASNYANIANIALQTAAINSKNPNVVNAARIGNATVGALNVYESGKPNGASTAGGSMTQIGQTPSGQPVYRDASGATVAYAGVNASGQPVYQSATSSSASNSATTPSGQIWGSSSRERMEVSPGQMSADATAFARKNGVPDYANGETTSTTSGSSSWNNGQISAEGALAANARGTPVDNSERQGSSYPTDSQVASSNANSGSSSWTAGQISPEGAAAAVARGTPVDNSELQGSPSYAAYPELANSNANSGSSSWNNGQISAEGALAANARGTPVDNSERQGSSYPTEVQTVNGNTTPAETVRTTYTPAARPAARPVARPAAKESATAPSSEPVPIVAPAAPSEWDLNSPKRAGYPDPTATQPSGATGSWSPNSTPGRAYMNGAPTSAAQTIPTPRLRGVPMSSADKLAADKLAADKKAAAINSYLKNTPSVNDFMQ